MRLVRLERQQSRVADDVRAALASLGRGSTVIGGIALIGVGSVTERPIEAVVLLPHGVIIVIGVDLPDPALRLEAPLGAEWKADGWPLVADDDVVNPATEALDISQACERRIASLVPGTAPVGTIIAVGPYVETVDQPAADLAGPVRVLHPTPTTMLAATVSLATAHRPRSVDQVRALIRGLAPSAPELSDEVLIGEGFSRLTDDSPPESLWDSPPPVPAARPAPAAAPADPGAAAAASPTAGAAWPDPATADQAAASETSPAEAPAAYPEPATAAASADAVSALPDPATTDQATASKTETSPPEKEAPAARPEPTIAAASAAPALPDSATADQAAASETEISPAEEEAPAARREPAIAATSADATPTLPDPMTTDQAAASKSDTSPPEKEAPATRPKPAIAAASAAPALPNAVTTDQAAASETEISPAAARWEPAIAAASTDATPALPDPVTTDQAPASKTEISSPEVEAPAAPPPAVEEALAEAGPTESLPSPHDDPDAVELPPRPVFPGAAPATPPLPRLTPAVTPEPPAGDTGLPAPSAPEAFAPEPRPQPGPAAAASRTVRWLPLGAIGLLVVLVVAAIVVATTGDGTAAAPPPASVTPPPSTASSRPAPVKSLQFALRAADGDQRCASHAFGDAQASLQQTSCAGVRRASYAATVDGRPGAVTIGIVEFPDAGHAAAFKAVADTPGGGGILDLAAETGKWGATAPRFENAAYASKLDDTSVRLVQAVWVPGPSTPDDPGLVRAAKAALDLPAQ